MTVVELPAGSIGADLAAHPAINRLEDVYKAEKVFVSKGKEFNATDKLDTGVIVTLEDADKSSKAFAPENIRIGAAIVRTRLILGRMLGGESRYKEWVKEGEKLIINSLYIESERPKTIRHDYILNAKLIRFGGSLSRRLDEHNAEEIYAALGIGLIKVEEAMAYLNAANARVVRITAAPEYDLMGAVYELIVTKLGFKITNIEYAVQEGLNARIEAEFVIEGTPHSQSIGRDDFERMILRLSPESIFSASVRRVQPSADISADSPINTKGKSSSVIEVNPQNNYAREVAERGLCRAGPEAVKFSLSSPMQNEELALADLFALLDTVRAAQHGITVREDNSDGKVIYLNPRSISPSFIKRSTNSGTIIKGHNFVSSPLSHDEQLDMLERARKYWSLKYIEERIMATAKQLGEEKGVAKWVDNLKKAARKNGDKQKFLML